MLSKNFFQYNLWTIFFVSTVISGLYIMPNISFAKISINSYCQLSMQNLQQEVSNLQELIALANQYKNDPQAFTEQEAIKQSKFEQEKTTLFSSFGITDVEYATYMGKNGRAVNDYLNANPAMKQQIDDLSGRIILLLEKFESLKGINLPGEPAVPPL